MQIRKTKPRITGDNVMLKMEPERKFTDSGLEIIEKICTLTTPTIGTVLAVGQGKYIDGVLKPPDVKPGDKVIIPEWAGYIIEIDRKQYVIVKEDDILAILS